MAANSPMAARSTSSFVVRHERLLIGAWLALCAAALGAMAVWGIAWNGAERLIDARSEAWVAELETARALLDSGADDRALALLERLDRECPATFVKHRQDRERERLLAMLGEANLRLDRKKRALEAFARAAQFDPKNFANHFRLAEAARELGESDLARTEYAAVLAIHPTHTPSVAALVDMNYDAGNYAPIPELFERYIDAWMLATVHVELGTTRVALDLPVDGSLHEVRVPVSLPADWKGEARVLTHGYSARVESLRLVAPLLAGRYGEPSHVEVDCTRTGAASGGTRTENGELAAESTESALALGQISLPQGASRAELKIALFRPIPLELWKQEEKSFTNRLLLPRWRELQARIRRSGAPEAGVVFED